MSHRVKTELILWTAALLLCGCGRSTAPTLSHCSVTPARLVFDATHPTRTFVILNTGPRRINGTVISYGDFLAHDSYDLRPGQSDTVTVLFRPRSEGHRSATLTTGCSEEVPCEGEGVLHHLQLIPRCDTYTTPAEPDRVFELEPTLTVGVLGPAPPTGFEMAFLMFDLSTLPYHYVSRAVVALHQLGCEPDGAELRMVCGATTDTVYCSSATATTLRRSFYTIETIRPVGCGPGTVEFDVTSIVNGYLTGLYDVRGLVVTPIESTPAPSHHRFDSMEGQRRPVLSIDYVAPG